MHLNTQMTGGAAIAAKRLHQGLLESGVDSSLLFKYGYPEGPSYIKWIEKKQSNIATIITRKLDILSRKRQKKREQEKSFYLNGRPEGFELFRPIKLDAKLRFEDLPLRPDIVNLHWIAGFFDFETFFLSIPDNVPIVWTLHDMNPFTGGCHYSWECDEYTRNCGNCPQLANSNSNDLSRTILNEKRNIVGNKSIHIVANSHWIESQAKQSSIFQNASSIQTIHYGIEIELLIPKDKESCKRALGIDPGCKVIVFGSDNIANRRKGFAELTAAIEILNSTEKDIYLLTFGNKSDASIYSGDAVKHLGYISSFEILSIVYSAADVFVMPSLYEAFGQVALEAMSCGIPVISFDNGGADDMVIDGVTGFIAEKGDVEDLADKLLIILRGDRERAQMGVRARNMVVNNFSKKKQVLKYKKFYEEIYFNDQV